MYKKIYFLFIVLFTLNGFVKAQYQSYQAGGELGVGVGPSVYFGDLNPSDNMKPQGYTAGAYYQKYFNNYIGLKLAVNYVRLHATDATNSNPVYRMRNLNFTNNMAELSLAANFNFFNYAPGFPGHEFTPYVSLGIGGIYTNPFTTDSAGNKVYLRPLGTEGQNSATPHDGKKYGLFAMVFPLSVGVRQGITQRISVFAEVGYRFTTTDYLDDVSATYAGAAAFDPANYKGSAAQAALAKQLQDRSVNQTMGVQGWQRGNSTVKDSYLLFQIGISYNFNKCNCPGVY